MKRKYLAIVLSLSMVFSVTSPVMAFSDELHAVEEISEDTSADDEDELEVSVSLEEDTETIEADADEEEDNFEITQFSDDEAFFDDGSETTFAVGDGEITDDVWTPLENESSISFKYDESNKTLYFKCSGTAEMPSNNQSGSTAQWALALKDKTKNAGILAKRFSDKYNKKQLKIRKMCIKIQENAYNKTLFDRWIGYSLTVWLI